MRLLVAALAAGLALSPAFAAPDALTAELSAMAKRHRGKVAFYAQHLKTGQTVALNADTPVRTASVIKLAIFLEAYRQIDEGKHSLNETVTLSDANRVLGSGVLGFLHSGLPLTLEDVLVLMMVVSDNTATNMAIDVFGVDAVNANAQRLGLQNTHLYKKVQVPATWPMPEDQPQFGLGKTTAREAAQLILQVERCTLKHPALCRRMLEVLLNQQHRNMVARLLETEDFTEERSSIGSKSGGLNKVRNDVALVYTLTGPVVISAFSYENQDERWTCENQAELLLAKMAKKVIDAWSPKGLLRGGPPQLAVPEADAGTASPPATAAPPDAGRR